MRDRKIYVVTDVYEYLEPQMGCEQETPSCAFSTVDEANSCAYDHRRTYRDQLRYTDMRYVDSFVYVIPFQVARDAEVIGDE